MINGYSYITLATDASVGETRAGMAYYIRDDNGTLKDVWSVDEKIDSNEAEWLALQGALKVISNTNYPSDTILIYYCDNATMIKLVNCTFRSVKALKNWGLRMIWTKHITDQFYRVDARHVKGHTNKTGLARYTLNRWCDFNSRAMMRHGKRYEYRQIRKT